MFSLCKERLNFCQTSDYRPNTWYTEFQSNEGKGHAHMIALRITVHLMLIFRITLRQSVGGTVVVNGGIYYLVG